MRFSTSVFVVLPLLAICSLVSAEPVTFHVTLEGSDANVGTPEAPFATLMGARDAIRALKTAGSYPGEGVRVVIHGGRYFLAEPFVLEPQDSGTESGPIVYEAAPGEAVVVSGGRSITGWAEVSAGRWEVKLDAVAAGEWYFRQLFADGRRLQRARTPNAGYLTTAGPLTVYADIAANRYGGYGKVGTLRTEEPAVFCGFSFSPGDFGQWDDLGQAEVMTCHSWECSWQSVQRVDLEARDVFFNTPCRYPVGFFSPHCRYRIENVEAALDEPGEWYLAHDSGTLVYLAKEGEDPESMDFVAPRLERLVELAGKPETDESVEHVRFEGITFAHAAYPMCIYDVAPDWPEPALKVYPEWPKEFWPGYTDAQAAPRCGEAIHLKGARDCVFENCTIRNVGAFGLAIVRGCRNVVVEGCEFTDMGGGGVLIGVPIRDVTSSKFPRELAASNNRVSGCRITNGGNVHPSAVGIWVAQSHHNTISHNEIADMGYSGISLGWTWNRNPNHSDNNILEGNHIHNVLQVLDDGGGIYTLGVLEGCVFRGNYIHGIQKSEGAIGAPVNGIFFDQGSRDIVVEGNVIRDTDGAVRFNQCTRDDMVWEGNFFDTPLEGEAADVASAAGP